MAGNLKHPTIGVLAGWQFYWTATPLSYLDPLYRGIRVAAAAHGCNLLLGCGVGPSADSRDPMRPAWPVRSAETDFVPIGPWNTDGIIAVNPLHAQARTRYLQELRTNGHPLVFIGSGEAGPTIVADNEGGIRAAVHHLVQHGHTHIGFIAGSPEDMDGDTGARLRAFQAAQKLYALPADDRLIAFSHHIFTGGQAAMQQLLNAGLPFTAVLASNDEAALGAMQALGDAGRRIPDDVAIIGFDDRPESAVQTPPLSSVHLPLFQMGYQAVDLLLQQINRTGEVPERVEVGTRLVPRASCGCAGNGIITLPLDGVAQSGHDVADAPGADPALLAQTMSTAVLAESQKLHADDVQAFCRRLLASFVASLALPADQGFQTALDALLLQTVADGDDAHIWQAAVSVLGNALPHLIASSTPSPARAHATALLDDARMAISAAMWRQHRGYARNERWTMNRVGLLTANLLTALDEARIFQVLAQHLPAMGIQVAWLATFESAADGDVEWSTFRAIVPEGGAEQRLCNRAFPPATLLPDDQPFSLALLPLVSQRGQLGYVAFEATQLMLYGAIVQEMAAALNTAQLYREATEGRRLAEEANLMKSRFLSTVSHELRTPLNVIVGTSGILLQESSEHPTALPAEFHRDIERMHGSAQHLAGLIGDVLDLASNNAGQLRLNHEFVDLGQALRMVVETGQRLAADKGLAWHATVPEAGPWVWGDRTRLRQVVLNLVTNAVKFTAHGTVALRVASTSTSVTVEVSDTGIGIAPAEQQMIFDEFRRSERSIIRGYGGLGLGLAIAKRLVELHGGMIGVQSSGEERAGTTFAITLPAAPAPDLRVSRLPAAVDAQRDLLVLVAAAGDRRLIAYLVQRGFHVHERPIEDPQGWLAELMVTPYDAVVVDVHAAPENAWHTLQAVKQNPATAHIPVLFFGMADRGGAVLAFDYLTKPVEVPALTHALEQHQLAVDASQPPRTILVVDDDPETLETHARIVQLHASANRVLRARNGREALALLQRMPVDLVLLDLMMPDLDGFGVLERMRTNEALRDIPVIVVTGQSLTEAEMARLNNGVATVMTKGLYSLDETLAHLEAALEHRHRLSSDARRLVRKAMAFLHEHYAEPLTRSDIARYVGLDEDYLTHCFRQELGVTPIRYLNRYRVNQAKQLLTHTDKPITVIALDVGFADSGYFSRIFRREVGISPQAYRHT